MHVTIADCTKALSLPYIKCMYVYDVLLVFIYLFPDVSIKPTCSCESRLAA